MAGRKSARVSERVERQEKAAQKQEHRKSAILSSHEELRERLLETAIDVKENIPAERRGSSRTSGSESVSDCSESRKRRSTKEGPAAKRPSCEKNASGDESTDYISGNIISSSSALNLQPLQDVSEDRSFSSAGSSVRARGQALPVMLEEDEVFEEMPRVVGKEAEKIEDDLEADVLEDELEDEEEMVEEDDERNSEGESEDGMRDESDEDDLHIQNMEFASTKRHMNDDERTVPAPSLLSAAKCEGIGSPVKVWSLMVKRDEIARATCLFKNHPTMDEPMRQVLVDWMMEVCESEKMHRETFHLAVDYLDRYLENTENEVTNINFQLVGTTALFVAAKYEEIYPIKCADFANLTDGAFSQEDIRDMEILLVSDINWTLGPITSIHWLSTYLQIIGTERSHQQNPDDHYVEGNMYIPELLRTEFVEMCQILDYLLLDIRSFEFSYRTLAAAVLFVVFEPRRAVEQATGLRYDNLAPVIRYVRPVCNVFNKKRELGDSFPVHQGISPDDVHNIQVHVKHKNYDREVAIERDRLNRQRVSVKMLFK